MSTQLVIQTAFLGDLLLSVPLLLNIKLRGPQDKIILVCRQGLGNLFLELGLADQVLEIVKKDAKSYSKILKEIKKHEIQNVYSPHESWRTAFFVRKIKAKNKISFYKFGKSLFFTNLVVRDVKLPDPIRQLSLLGVFYSDINKLISDYVNTAKPYQLNSESGLEAPPIWASMYLGHELKNKYSQLNDIFLKYNLDIKKLNKTALIFPGSVWATKRWTATGYIELGQKLRNQSMDVILMGGAGEEALCEGIADKIPQAISLAGKSTLFETLLLISLSALVVGNDSASIHLSSLAGTPTVAIFGPTVLSFGFRPWSEKAYIAQDDSLTCRPCGKHGHRKCPIGTHVCMKNITSEKIYELALQAVKELTLQ